MSKVRVILQSRTLSERLPAKVLLPLGGLPIAVLCARRLANTGLDVVLATSDTASDDLLARTAAEAGIRVFRGSLDDVLGRFAACAADLAPEDVVVRATGDNPLPDGAFVQSLVDRLRAGGHRYLGTASPADGLPYGLSAECFTVAALRDADRNATDPASREHVTVSMRRAADAGRVRPGELLPNDRSALRCTVDTADDYLRAARVFAGEVDPVRVPWRTLVERLEADAAAHPRRRRGCPT
jgi:spore coat polysaccharide biosynthesis protein SpsF